MTLATRLEALLGRLAPSRLWAFAWLLFCWAFWFAVNTLAAAGEAKASLRLRESAIQPTVFESQQIQELVATLDTIQEATIGLGAAVDSVVMASFLADTPGPVAGSVLANGRASASETRSRISHALGLMDAATFPASGLPVESMQRDLSLWDSVVGAAESSLRLYSQGERAKALAILENNAPQFVMDERRLSALRARARDWGQRARAFSERTTAESTLVFAAKNSLTLRVYAAAVSLVYCLVFVLSGFRMLWHRAPKSMKVRAP